MYKCSNCGMIEEVFNTKLNKQGICNYCEFWSSKKEFLTDYEKKHILFQERIDVMKGKYEYDALVGLSGGKDSTYVLSKLVCDYGLNVLAITYDNGYLSDWAKSSIKRTVETLDVDHCFYKPSRDIHNYFYRLSIRKLGDPCFACAFAGYFYAIKLCFDKNIPFFIHGRSPYQMYRNLYAESKDLFLPMIMLNHEKHSFEKLKPVYEKVLASMRAYVIKLAGYEKNEINQVLNEFFMPGDLLDSSFVPEFLGYFIYHEYNEMKIKKEIAEKVGWIRSENDYMLGHYDCKIHDVAGYLFKELNNVDILIPDLASMIRLGHINIDEAKELQKISQPTQYALSGSIKTLCKDLSITKKELIKTIEDLKAHGVRKFNSR